MKHRLMGPITAGVLAITSQPALAVTDVFRFVGFGQVSGAMGGAATAFDVGAACCRHDDQSGDTVANA